MVNNPLPDYNIHWVHLKIKTTPPLKNVDQIKGFVHLLWGRQSKCKNCTSLVIMATVQLGSQAHFCHLTLTIQKREITGVVGFLPFILSGLPNYSWVFSKTHETNLTQRRSLFLLPEMTIDKVSTVHTQASPVLNSRESIESGLKIRKGYSRIISCLFSPWMTYANRKGTLIAKCLKKQNSNEITLF